MASKSITIVGGYFLPGRKFLRILSYALNRGVNVRIILTRFSDSIIVKLASEYLYGRLLRSNIRIFESTNAMVHGKVAVVDETWSTIGSYNQNHLSAYISIELNLDVVNYGFSRDLNQHLLEVMETECVEITSDIYYKKSSPMVKLKRWTAYQIVRVSLRMLFVVNRIFGIND